MRADKVEGSKCLSPKFFDKKYYQKWTKIDAGNFESLKNISKDFLLREGT